MTKAGYKIVIAEDYRDDIEEIRRAIDRGLYGLRDIKGELTIIMNVGEDDEV